MLKKFEGEWDATANFGGNESKGNASYKIGLGGLWLLIGPSLYPVWSDRRLEPLAGADWKRALLWIGYFYGVGAIVVWLAGYGQGLVTRRTRVEETQVAEPQYERTVTEG